MMGRQSFALAVAILLLTASIPRAQTMASKTFKAEMVTRTSTITINTGPEHAFGLFGAFEERKWAHGWNPTLIYPSSEIIEEGTTFKTSGHGHDEDEFLWRVNKYQPRDYLIEYLVLADNRYWTIRVKCSEAGVGKTLAEITYTFIGLNVLGNQINRYALERMFRNDLIDWQDAINSYLSGTK